MLLLVLEACAPDPLVGVTTLCGVEATSQVNAAGEVGGVFFVLLLTGLLMSIAIFIALKDAVTILTAKLVIERLAPLDVLGFAAGCEHSMTVWALG